MANSDNKFASHWLQIPLETHKWPVCKMNLAVPRLLIHIYGEKVVLA